MPRRPTGHRRRSGQSLEALFLRERLEGMYAVEPPPRGSYYPYRRGRTGSFHMSAMGEEDVDRFVDGRLRRGEVELVPRWRNDYVGLIAEHLAAEGVS